LSDGREAVQPFVTAIRYKAYAGRVGSIILRPGPWRVFLTWRWLPRDLLPRFVVKVKRAAEREAT
jgi:hypothetical protein